MSVRLPDGTSPHSDYHLTREERETIITTTDADDLWHVYTCSPAVGRRLARVAVSFGVELRQDGDYGVSCDLPAAGVRLTVRPSGGQGGSGRFSPGTRRGKSTSEGTLDAPPHPEPARSTGGGRR